MLLIHGQILVVLTNWRSYFIIVQSNITFDYRSTRGSHSSKQSRLRTRRSTGGRSQGRDGSRSFHSGSNLSRVKEHQHLACSSTSLDFPCRQHIKARACPTLFFPLSSCQRSAQLPQRIDDRHPIRAKTPDQPACNKTSPTTSIMTTANLFDLDAELGSEEDEEFEGEEEAPRPRKQKANIDDSSEEEEDDDEEAEREVRIHTRIVGISILTRQPDS